MEISAFAPIEFLAYFEYVFAKNPNFFIISFIIFFFLGIFLTFLLDSFTGASTIIVLIEFTIYFLITFLVGASIHSSSKENPEKIYKNLIQESTLTKAQVEKLDELYKEILKHKEKYPYGQAVENLVLFLNLSPKESDVNTFIINSYEELNKKRAILDELNLKDLKIN